MRYFTQKEREILEFLIRQEIIDQHYDAVIDKEDLNNIYIKIHYLDEYLDYINLNYGIPESMVEIKKTKPVKAWKKEDK